MTGVGVPAGFDFDDHANFGLLIVRGLVENQLHGSIEFSPGGPQGNGLSCRFTLGA